MKHIKPSELKQYARVARIFPKTTINTSLNTTNARIKVLATTNPTI